MTKSIAILNTSSSFGDANGRESLDAAMIFASYELPVALFFAGDGVYQSVKGQNASMLENKDYQASFGALPFYDIEQVYICGKSLKERQLPQDFCLADVCVLSPAELREKLNEFDTVLRF